MSRLSTKKESELQPQTLNALEQVRTNGALAPVYLQFANSESALMAYLQMEQSVREGSLTEREIEAVKLRVSQHTGCDFCLSIHAGKAAKAGISKADQLRLRAGEAIGDDRVDSLIVVASTLLSASGPLPDDVLSKVRAAGISDENLVDLTMVISTIFFTNITNHVNHTSLDI